MKMNFILSYILDVSQHHTKTAKSYGRADTSWKQHYKYQASCRKLHFFNKLFQTTVHRIYEKPQKKQVKLSRPTSTNSKWSSHSPESRLLLLEIEPHAANTPNNFDLLHTSRRISSPKG